MQERALRVQDVLLLPERLEEVTESYLGISIKALKNNYGLRHLAKSPFVSPGKMDVEYLDKFPPILIHAGGADMLLDDIYEFVKNSRGKCEQLRVWEHLPHVFQMLPGFLLPASQESLGEIAAFFTKKLTLK